MPIYLFDYKTREGVTPFYILNFYNHIIAFAKEPIRSLADQTASISLVVYAVPSIMHIGICLLLGSLIHKGLKRLLKKEQ